MRLGGGVVSSRVVKSAGVLAALLVIGLSGAAAAATSQSFSYDALGRVIAVTSGNGVKITYAYDAAGNRTSKVAAGGKVIVFPNGAFLIPIR